MLRSIKATAILCALMSLVGCKSTSIDINGPTGEIYTSELKFHNGDIQSSWTVNYVVTQIFDSTTMKKVYETSKFLPDLGAWLELPVGDYIVMHRCYYVYRTSNKERYSSVHEDTISVREGQRIEFKMPIKSAPKNGCRAVPKVLKS